MTVTPLHLGVRRPDAEVVEEFEYMLDQANKNGWVRKLPCHNRPDVFADYKKSPTQERAQELCSGCPLLELCNPYAYAKKRPWTVLGGVSWVDGRPFEQSVAPKIAA